MADFKIKSGAGSGNKTLLQGQDQVDSAYAIEIGDAGATTLTNATLTAGSLASGVTGGSGLTALGTVTSGVLEDAVTYRNINQDLGTGDSPSFIGFDSNTDQTKFSISSGTDYSYTNLQVTLVPAGTYIFLATISTGKHDSGIHTYGVYNDSDTSELTPVVGGGYPGTFAYTPFHTAATTGDGIDIVTYFMPYVKASSVSKNYSPYIRAYNGQTLWINRRNDSDTFPSTSAFCAIKVK